MAITYPEGAEWPPKPYDRAAKDMKRYQAWYAGDTDELTNIYSSAEMRQRISVSTGHFSHAGDTYFWGRPNPQGTKRRHVPTPANISRASSDLLFSQPPKIMPGPADEDNGVLIARMEEIFGDDRFSGLLSEAAETASFLGGVYLVPWWDVDIEDHVMPGIRDADNAVPEWSYDRLRAVTFWSILSEPGETPVIRHLERHEKGTITHALYSGDGTSLGKRLPLTGHPATEWADGVTNDRGEIQTNIDRMHVTYVPNVRPSRAWRSDPRLSHLGRSDYEGIESEFDALDEVQTSWLRDVENAKSRIFVDERLLADDGPGQGGSFDVDQQVYTKTRPQLSMAAAEGSTIESVQFNIRWSEHAQTSAEILQHILQNVGISAQQFTDGALAVGVTATEINTRNTISENTRQKKINYWSSALTDHVENVLLLDAAHFGTGIRMNDRPSVQFPARAVQSEADQAQVIATKRTSNVISVETAVKTLNPDWSEKEVEAEIQRIREDQVTETKLAYGEGLDMGEEEADAETMPDEGMDKEADTADEYADDTEAPDDMPEDTEEAPEV